MEKNDCPPLIVGGVHITDVKLCHLHEDLSQLRDDFSEQIGKLNERIRAIEEKIALCKRSK